MDYFDFVLREVVTAMLEGRQKKAADLIPAENDKYAIDKAAVDEVLQAANQMLDVEQKEATHIISSRTITLVAMGLALGVIVSLLGWTVGGSVASGIAATVIKRTEAALQADEEEIRKLNEELEEKVAQRTEQLAVANHELEAFTYSVSHDLRAPLRHITGFSKILSEDFSAGMEPEARSHLQRIEDGARRMGLLVDELLNLARVGRHALKLQNTDLNAVVEEVVSLLQPEAEGRKIDWEIGTLPWAVCDPILTTQVFQNLLSNALKFTRTRERAVIEIAHRQENGETIIMVKDNGVGFNMKYKDKLFGVFQRLHRAEDFEGTGIGLATIQRIIHRHGGRVWAQAELDRGATFYFTLCAAKPAGVIHPEITATEIENKPIESKATAAGVQR